ncbi:MAG: IclR family transcriptional regulator C-terminal domain-containing protein [Burkholderiaceae bacterium]
MRNDRVRLSMDRALSLNRELDITVIVSVWGDLGPTVIAWFDRSTKLICNSYIGSVYPLLTTATGRAFLAYLPGETAMNHVKYELGLGPDESLPASLKKRIQAIQASVRERGLGTVDGDVIPGLSAFGVPTFDIQGRIATVIGVISESNSLTGQKGEKVARALLAAGADVTRSQGFVPGLDSPRSYAQWLDGVWANALVTSQSTEAEGPRRRRRQNSGTSIPVG